VKIAWTVVAGTAAFLCAALVSHASQPASPGSPTTVASAGADAIGAASDHSAEGALLFDGYGCRACHSLGGEGAQLGPALDHVRARKSRAEIVRWLDDPQKIKPGTKMPTFQFTPAQEQALADYLLSR
jgi:cytochrome c2